MAPHLQAHPAADDQPIINNMPPSAAWQSPAVVRHRKLPAAAGAAPPPAPDETMAKGWRCGLPLPLPLWP
jgi:hypothetical protein